MDDLDDHLARLDTFQDFGTNRLGANLVRERADNIEGNVSFDEGPAHFAQSRRDVGIRQRATAGQAIQNRT
jgi:hypothetical protein